VRDLEHHRCRQLLDDLRDDLREIGDEHSHWDEAFFASRRERYVDDTLLMSRHFEAGPVVEIGALPCHMTALLEKLGLEVVAVDVDPTRARRLIALRDLDVRAADIETEPLPGCPDEEFGFAILTEVFEHLHIDPLFVLSEVNRVLRPGGVLFLSTPNLYSLDKVVRYLRGGGFNDPLAQFQFLRKVGHMGHIREYSVREMTRLLEYSGFEVIDVVYRNYHDYGGGVVGFAVRCAHALLPRMKARQIILCRKVGTPERLAVFRRAVVG
jgi:SAM-dependent methyltransferase